MAGEACSAKTGHGRRWDVALSFAGAQRDYVGQVAAALKARGMRCFYDADEQVRLWGTHLAEELPTIYARESAAVVVFISADYAGREWTRLERRAAFSRAVVEAGVYVLPARFDDSELPGLLDDVVTIDLRRHSPEQFAELIADKLAAIALSQLPPPPGTDPGRPPGAVRVSGADLRRLGVQAAISVPGVSDEHPPEYVLRDTDTDEHGVRVQVAAAAQRGGFVLLTGGSSVGKTRCAAEAVKVLLPDWWLVHPASPAEVAALATAPPVRTVVWLDELQRCLDGENGLAGGTVRALLNAPDPVVIIGTLWPDRYAAYTAVPAPGGPDPQAREREVLELAAVVQVSGEFSALEKDRARDAATRDPRLAAAVKVEGYGLTQTLAAAPQLIARWENATTVDPYGWAVLTAALDAARLGARAPLSAGFLRAAAPGYCSSRQQAEAPENWFEQALGYATSKLHGAAAALGPAGAGMGKVAGYLAADYLIQHVGRQRRYARPPASTWDAILTHIRDPSDAGRLAGSARNRFLYRYAIPLYQYAADFGNRWALKGLVDLLNERGDPEGAARVLRTATDAGDGWAAGRLAELLRKCGDLDGAVQTLQARALAGDQAATWRLAGVLRERGDLDGLRARAEVGDEWAVRELITLMAESSDLDGAAQILRARAEAGDGWATLRLAALLYEHGDRDGAARALQARADAGDQVAARCLASLLDERNELDEADKVRRARPDADDQWPTAIDDLDNPSNQADVGDRLAHLATLMREHIFRGRADASAIDIDSSLAEVLYELGELDRLRAQADAGDPASAVRLADLLGERGDIKALRAQADAGNQWAARPLITLLTKQGRRDEAEKLRRFGLNPDGSIACT